MARPELQSVDDLRGKGSCPRPPPPASTTRALGRRRRGGGP